MRYSSRALAAANTQYTSWVQERFRDPNATRQPQRVRSVGLALLKAQISATFLALSDNEKVRRIKDATCAVYGIPPSTMDRKPQPGEVSPARQIALFLCDQTTALTYVSIGHLFCYQTNAPISPTVKKVKLKLADPDQKTRDALVEICARLESAN